jgi:hypothetical protein
MNASTRLILPLLIGAIAVSYCGNVSEPRNDKPDEGLSKKEIYERIMDRKNFRMEVNGPCDDALEDTIHEWYVPYYPVFVTFSGHPYN